MSRLNLEISPGQVIWPRLVLVLGLGIVFAPLDVAACLYIPTGDPIASRQMALQALENLRGSQALALSYFDCFLTFAVMGVALALLVFWRKRSMLEKGAHVAAG